MALGVLIFGGLLYDKNMAIYRMLTAGFASSS